MPHNNRNPYFAYSFQSGDFAQKAKIPVFGPGTQTPPKRPGPHRLFPSAGCRFIFPFCANRQFCFTKHLQILQWTICTEKVILYMIIRRFRTGSRTGKRVICRSAFFRFRPVFPACRPVRKRQKVIFILGHLCPFAFHGCGEDTGDKRHSILRREIDSIGN